MKNSTLASDIRYAKQVAADFGHTITDEQAKKALKICKGDHYRMKEYFAN